MRHIKWSKTEKVIARQAFENAYQKECAALASSIKKMVDNVGGPDDIWQLYDFLGEKREDIDKKYDYRYSVLIFVFARLMKEGWIEAADLDGLSEDKVTSIVALATM